MFSNAANLKLASREELRAFLYRSMASGKFPRCCS
jgi:hypothetical protein